MGGGFKEGGTGSNDEETMGGGVMGGHAQMEETFDEGGGREGEGFWGNWVTHGQGRGACGDRGCMKEAEKTIAGSSNGIRKRMGKER